jgi:hypothetical protein
MNPLPRFLRVRQSFPAAAPVEIGTEVKRELAPLLRRIGVGAQIAVGVGSRGIANLAPIVRAVVDEFRAMGAQPFLIPAMGSHGGATPEGQRQVLADFGVTEDAMGAPIRTSMEVKQVGVSQDGAPVFCSVEALDAAGIFLINRIKPHTDFTGGLGSGLLKMSVIGLGKRIGATAMHTAASRAGHERAIREMARVLLRETPILGGLAILENQQHETARLIGLSADELEDRETMLLEEATRLMPRLPFDEIDLLIVDRLGKNISGAGMDPNVIGRPIQGYSSALLREARLAPFIRRIFVRELTPETHGNAVGIGLADITTTRLVGAIDLRATHINALTALTPQSAKIPIHFETDREAIDRSVASLALDDSRGARIVRIADTLSLTELEVSEPLWKEWPGREGLAAVSEAGELQFDGEGNLTA